MASMSMQQFNQLVVPRVGDDGHKERAIELFDRYGKGFSFDIGNVLLKAIELNKIDDALLSLEALSNVPEDTEEGNVERMKIIMSTYRDTLGIIF